MLPPARSSMMVALAVVLSGVTATSNSRGGLLNSTASSGSHGRRLLQTMSEATFTVVGPNSCEYANDGACDEPDKCTPGTDCTDCSMYGNASQFHKSCPTPAPTAMPTWATEFNQYSSLKYGYLVPYHDNKDYHGRAIRIDLNNFHAKFTDLLDFNPPALKESCADPSSGHDSGEENCGLVGFAGGFIDARGYGYYSPSRTFQDYHHGKVARVSMASFTDVEYVDIAATFPDCTGFVGGYSAGQWAYFLPRYNGIIFFSKVTRVNIMDWKTIEVLDLAEIDSSLTGFFGGFMSGSHGYLVPDNDRIDEMGNFTSKVVRFNLGSFSEVESLDLAETDPSLVGFRGSFTYGMWGYLVPYAGQHGPHGYFTRLNIQDFQTVQYIDLTRINPALKGFIGGMSASWDELNVWTSETESYTVGYLVPYKNNYGNGDYHGMVTRVRITEFDTIAQMQAVARLPLAERQIVDDRYAEQILGLANSTFVLNEAGTHYGFAINATTKEFMGDSWEVILRVNIDEAVQTLDLTTIDDSLRGFSGGFVDDVYAYFVPQFSGAIHKYAGTVVRIQHAPYGEFNRERVQLLDLQDHYADAVGYNFGMMARFEQTSSLESNCVGCPPGMNLVADESYGAPSQVAYTQNPAQYTVGFTIKRNAPTYFGGLATECSIIPDLPQGLTFDPFSGTIEGQPKSATKRTIYTVTLKNAVGEVRLSLDLKVGIGNFGYMLPSANGQITRLNLNDFRTTQTLDLANTNASWTGFTGGFVDLGYAYLVPGQRTSGGVAGYFGTALRVDLNDFSTVAPLELTWVDPALRGFVGGFSHEGFAYYVPGYGGAHAGTADGKFVRVKLDTWPETPDAFPECQIEVLDLGLISTGSGLHQLMGFSGGFGFREFAILVPNYNGEYHGNVVRIDLTKFTSAAGVEYQDLRRIEGDVRGFSGGFEANQFGYLVPYYNGKQYHSNVVRIMLSWPTFSAAPVESITLTDHNPELVGFKSGFATEEWAYFVPYARGTLARVKLEDFSTVQSRDLALLQPGLKGYAGGFVVGKFAYLVPHFEGGVGDYSGKVLRIDTGAPDMTVAQLDMVDIEKQNPMFKGYWGGFYYMTISFRLKYQENAPPVNVIQFVSLAEIEASVITSASVAISPVVPDDVLQLPMDLVFQGQPGDDQILWLPNEFGISGRWIASSGRLQLSGGASRESYEATLRRVAFQSVSEDPDERTRTGTVTVQDALVQKVVVDVTKVDDPPVMTTVPAAILYIEKSPAKLLAPDALITDVEFDLYNQIVAAQQLFQDIQTGATNVVPSDEEMARIQKLMQMSASSDRKYNLRWIKVLVTEGYEKDLDELILEEEDNAYLQQVNLTKWEDINIVGRFNLTEGSMTITSPLPTGTSIAHFEGALRAVQWFSYSRSGKKRKLQYSLSDGLAVLDNCAVLEIMPVSREVSLSVRVNEKYSSELGDSGHITVLCSVQPEAPVLISITTTNAEEGIADPSFAVLSPDNWLEGVNVTVAGQLDFKDDGDVPYSVIVFPIASDDLDYLMHPVLYAPLVNRDDPINKAEVLANPIFCTTKEAGDSCFFNLNVTGWHSSFETLTITLTTTAPSEGKLVNQHDNALVETTTFSFDQANWATGTTMFVRGQDDSKDDEDVNYMIELSAEIKFAGTDQKKQIPASKMTTRIICSNIDDDTGGIVVERTCTTTSEAGEPCIFYIKLLSQPYYPVIFSIASDNELEGNVTQGRHFTVQPEDWATPSEIIIAGMNDESFDGDIPYTVSLVSESEDNVYHAFEDEFILRNLDNDIAELVVEQYGESLSGLALPVDETGSSTNFTVFLPRRPTGNATVVINLVSSNEAEVVLDTSQIIFNTSNWMVPRYITITGVDDDVQDGDTGVQVRLNTISADPEFDQVEWYFFLYNRDDDGLILSKPKCSIYETGEVCEVGLSLPTWLPGRFSQITWNVESLEPSIGTVSPPELVFNYTNWNTPLTLKVIPVNNYLDEPDKDFELNLKGRITYVDQGKSYERATSSRTFPVTSVNDDNAGIFFTQTTGSVVDEAGTTKYVFEVGLNSEPFHPVTIPVATSDDTEGATCFFPFCPTVLSFDSTNWMTPQRVVVQGVDDFVVDGIQHFEISSGPSQSDDPAFVGFSDLKAFTTTDDDVAGLKFQAETTTSSEAGRIAIVIASLTSEPVVPILFSVASLDASEGIPDPSIFVLSQQNWLSGLVIGLTGQSDNLDDGDVKYTVALTPIFTNDPEYLVAIPKYLELLNEDDPVNRMSIAVGPLVCTTTEIQTGPNVRNCTISVNPESWHTGEGAYKGLIVTITSDNPTEGKVLQAGEQLSPSTTMKFDNSTYRDGASFSIIGVDDEQVDGSMAYAVRITAQIVQTVSQAQNDQRAILGLQPLADQVKSVLAHKISGSGEVQCQNEDNDVSGVRLDSTQCSRNNGKLATSEAGTTCVVTLVLDTKPHYDVVFTQSVTDASEGTVKQSEGLSVTFTTTTWNVAQDIIITGVDDDIFDGDMNYNVTIGPSVSSDDMYAGRTFVLEMLNEENDNANLEILQEGQPMSGLALPTDESGSEQSFTVTLPFPPKHPVYMTVSTSRADNPNSGDGLSEVVPVINNVEGTIGTPAQLMIDGTNYDQAHKVVLRGVDDKITDRDQTIRVELLTSSTDTTFDNVQWYFLMVNEDDDGLVVSSKTCKTTESLSMDGLGVTGGRGESCTVVMSMETWRDTYEKVRFSITSSNTKEGDVYPRSYTINSDNWQTAKDVVITGIDDIIDDGTISYTVRIYGQLEYKAGVNKKQHTFEAIINVENEDDDAAGLQVVQFGNTTDEGLKDSTQTTVKVRLVTEPVNRVYIPLEVDTPGEARIEPGNLVFDKLDWNRWKTVKVFSVDDFVVDYDKPFKLNIGPSTSNDLPYAGHGDTLDFTNLDDDKIGLSIYYKLDTENSDDFLKTLPRNVTTEDGVTGGALYVRLQSEPKATVLFTVTTSNAQEAVAAPNILAFSSDDWNQDQIVNVRGADDAFLDGDQYYDVGVKTLYTADPDYADSVTGMLEGSLSFVNLDEATDRNPEECQAGYYGNQMDETIGCKKCPIGTFSDVTKDIVNIFDCKKCPYGTFGTARGATSPFGVDDGNDDDLTEIACRPCPQGTHQDIRGMASCQPCRYGIHRCTFGLHKPSSMNFSKLKGPSKVDHFWTVPQQKEYREIWEFAGGIEMTELTLPYAVTMVAWFFTISFYIVVATIYSGVKLDMWEEDVWDDFRRWLMAKDYFEEDHAAYTGDQEEGVTFIGGMTTILFMFWAYGLLALTGFLYYYYNETVEQSLVPKTEEATRGLRPDVEVYTEFHGYTGDCLTADLIVSSGVTADGGYELNVECNPEKSSLSTVWICRKCQLLTAPTVEYQLKSDDDAYQTSVKAIAWRVVSSPVIPGEDNSVIGIMKPSYMETQSFRGAEATALDISMITAKYSNFVDGIAGDGYRVQYMSETVGALVEEHNFMDPTISNEMNFRMYLTVNVVQLELVINIKASLFQAWADAGGLFGAVAGMVILGMNAIEFANAAWYALTNKIARRKRALERAAFEEASSSSSSDDGEESESSEEESSSDEEEESSALGSSSVASSRSTAATSRSTARSTMDSSAVSSRGTGASKSRATGRSFRRGKSSSRSMAASSAVSSAAVSSAGASMAKSSAKSSKSSAKSSKRYGKSKS